MFVMFKMPFRQFKSAFLVASTDEIEMTTVLRTTTSSREAATAKSDRRTLEVVRTDIRRVK